MKSNIRNILISTLVLALLSVAGVRIFQHQATSSSGPHLSYNVALNKPIIDSSGQVYYKDYAIKYPVDKITDGDFATGWRVQTDFPGSGRTQAIIDLQDNFHINQATIKYSWDGRQQFDDIVSLRLSWTSDNDPSLQNQSDWREMTTIALDRNQRGKVFTLDFPLTITRYIKVEYLKDDNKWAGWGNIYEIALSGY